MPTVSILVVFHRVSPYLDEAVRSLLGQTMRDVEVILVDNGTGTGPRTLADFGQDERLKLVSLPRNEGCAAAYRAGLPRARGEFIGVQGYDDVSLPRRLEVQVARLREEPSLGLVMSRARVIDGDGVEVGREFALLRAEECRAFSNYSNPGPASSFVGRAEAFARHAFRSEFDTAEDYDFLARVAEDWAIAGVDEELLLYRRHAAQVTRERLAEQVLRACVIRLLTARRRHGRPEDLSAAWASLGDWTKTPPELEVIYSHFARWALRERLPALAVYHARRLLATRRAPRTLVAAARVYASAVRQAPQQAGFLSRLFFTGPLRAHGLHPA